MTREELILDCRYYNDAAQRHAFVDQYRAHPVGGDPLGAVDIADNKRPIVARKRRSVGVEDYFHAGYDFYRLRIRRMYLIYRAKTAPIIKLLKNLENSAEFGTFAVLTGLKIFAILVKFLLNFLF